MSVNRCQSATNSSLFGVFYGLPQGLVLEPNLFVTLHRRLSAADKAPPVDAAYLC